MRRKFMALVVLTLVLVAFALPAAVSAHPHGPYDKVLTGTSGNDSISGTDGRDKISGLAGNDKLVGGPGRDLLLGGPGRDVLSGGNLHDELRGSVGNDKLLGGNGNDKLVGGPGRDNLFGGPGNDVLRASGDGFRDLVDCGKGTSDRAFVDARDIVTGCERITVVGQ